MRKLFSFFVLISLFILPYFIPNIARSAADAQGSGAFSCSKTSSDPVSEPNIIPSDGDDIEDSMDNCPNDYNPSQNDKDGDGLGDVCDPNPTGESEAELQCTEKIGDSCEFGGDCCEGQFCSGANTCQYCSEAIGVIGLPCRPGQANDCCLGQFCSGAGNACNLCPPEGQVTYLCFSMMPGCDSDQACQTRASQGEFNDFLLNVGYDPQGQAEFSCNPGIPEVSPSMCCAYVSEVIPICAGLSPEPNCSEAERCDGDAYCQQYVPDSYCQDGCCQRPPACQTVECDSTEFCQQFRPDAFCQEGCCALPAPTCETVECDSDEFCQQFVPESVCLDGCCQ